MTTGVTSPGVERRAPKPSDTWAIVLAAGEGQRLARLTRALYGRELPKQFAALDGNRTFLQQTLARSVRLTPCQRTVVVVSEEHAELARLQLAPFAGVRIVEQPRNVGTLPGLLLPLAHVLDAAPRARVVVYPADHHVLRLPPLRAAVGKALANVDRTPSRLVLVGAKADRAATDLGWIQAGHKLPGDEGLRCVERFVEKPNAASATQLFETGALWNTLLFAFDGATLWNEALAAKSALRLFQRYRTSVGTANEAAVRRDIYDGLPTLDLSRDLLASRSGLGVVEMKDAGWSDCGTPERLLACLELTGGLAWLLSRIAAAGTPPNR